MGPLLRFRRDPVPTEEMRLGRGPDRTFNKSRDFSFGDISRVKIVATTEDGSRNKHDLLYASDCTSCTVLAHGGAPDTTVQPYDEL